MLETPEELHQLQSLLDASIASAGPHLRGIISDERRLSAARAGRPAAGDAAPRAGHRHRGRAAPGGPVDGYFLHGTFWFSSGRDSVRMRHLAARPAVSATHLPGEDLAVTVHGRAERFAIDDAAFGELRQAMLDEYLPKQGPSFETWLDNADALGARIVPAKMFTFHLGD